MHVALNHGWTFCLADQTDAGIVDLPHCWNERDTFQLGVRYRQGTGTYTRTFETPRASKAAREGHWELRSEGFYGAGHLQINGHRVCRVDGQYLGLREDVTRYLRPAARNTIQLRLTNAFKRYVLPGKKNPDFLLYGGLSGRVWLVWRPGIHLDDRSLQVTCHNALSTRATVCTAVTVRNARSNAGTVRVRVSIRTPTGSVVASGSSEPGRLAPGRSFDTHVKLPLDHPALWDLEHPHLYRVECTLQVDGEPGDRAETRFGVREAVFSGDRGFFLNGKHVFLQGVNRHESIPGFGNALPASLHREDARQIHDLGLNFVRLSHYPQHPAFLDACDEFGLLVYAEIASWKSVRPGPWARSAYRQLREMIRRDRHHPSIVLWGFGNESRSRIAFRKMGRIVRALDPSRSTVYAENHLYRGIRWHTLKQTDVLGINYELDRLDDAHHLSRNGSILISEAGNCAYTKRGDEEAELKQIAAWERDIERIGNRPFVAGYALWCYADYASQRRGRCRRQPGLVDAWRLRKMSASYMQARTARTLFLSAHGNWGLHAGGPVRRIHVFSNAERLVLSVNGKVLADVPAKRYTLVTVPFHPDPLQVSASCGGEEERQVRLVPHGMPESIVMEPDRQTCVASERETVGVLVRVVDGDGTTVSDYHGEVRLSASGPGRIRSFTPKDVVEIHAGMGRCFVTGTGALGFVALCGTEKGLAEGSTVIQYKDDGSPAKRKLNHQRENELNERPLSCG